jgi:PilZ domain
MLDNRTEFRINAEGRAKISVPGQTTTIDCIVHNVSPSGACLEVDALSVPIPELFAIVPDDGDDLGYQCRVVWRKGNLMGIKFE